MPGGITINAADGVALEAELARPDAPARAGAVLCHPHPQFGGTMRSIVIGALFSALPALGVTCLRFNFRGVEASTGAFDHGRGERDDARAAIDALRAELPADVPLLLAGWSFGADVALSVHDAAISAWLAIAPPLRFAETDGLADDPRPKLLALAEHDEVRAPAEVAAAAEAWSATEVVVVPGASHFFVGRTDHLVELATGFIDRLTLADRPGDALVNGAVNGAEDWTTGPAARTFGYKPALDGLRAVAVGSVIAFHFGAISMPGGFLGVDTFFVLSGFLITSLLLVEWGSSGTVHFAAFWIRRARRLLPALLLVLLAVAGWAYFESATNQLDGIRADALWTLFYGANWRFISSGQSYFDLFVGEASPLRHARLLLAIEEQFYLVWPLVAYACLRLGRGRPRVLAVVCVLGTIGSALLCMSLYRGADPSRAYYGTDTRASQLLIGALLAIVLTRWAPRVNGSRVAVQVAGAAGAVFCLWAFLTVHDRDAWLYRGGFVVFAVATAMVIAAVVQPATTPLRAVLSLGPVRWVGRISYGLYLWHWPVQVAVSEGRTGLDGWDLAIARLALTFGIATASYYLVELPIRHGGLRGWAARISAPVGIAAVASVVLVATAAATAPPSFVSADPGQVIRRTTADAAAPAPPPKVSPAIQAIAPPTTTPPAPLAPGRIWVIGDSVLQSLTPQLLGAAAARGLDLETRTKPGCGILGGRALRPEDGTEYPWSGACEASAEGFQRDVGADPSLKVILWIDLWERFDRIVNGVTLDLDTPAGATGLLHYIDQTRATLTASGARLVLVAMPQNAATSQFPFTVEENRHVDVVNGLLRAVAALHPESTSLVDLGYVVCPNGPPCPDVVGGSTLRPEDGRHYSPEGAGYVAPRLLELMLGQLRKAQVAG